MNEFVPHTGYNLYTNIFEPYSFPVSASKLLWSLMFNSNLLVTFADKQV